VRRRRALAGTLLFLVAAPGVVAGLVPWLLTGWEVGDDGHWLVRAGGAVLVVVGVGVLLEAFARFALEGRGTPAPVAPTQELVVGGLYRYLRNPMYVAVIATILGQGMFLWRPILLAYAAVVAAAMWLFVRTYEEPTLAARYGDRYAAYRRAVPGWWPRRRPGTGEDG
jgi:protein-S-isoprenylcysteine O-methyltransferase Ste14